MKKVRFGIIGCGKIAECHHIPNLLELGKAAEVVALFDIKRAKAVAIAEKHQLSAKVCKTLDELLAEDLDAVIIATPNSTHCPLTLSAIAAGKHVLVEKPMAAHVADADRMIRAAEAKGVVLQVNQSFRYMPLYQEAKKVLDSGVIGDLLHAHCMRISSEVPSVSWSPGATWYVQDKFNGGVIFDHAVHMADVLQWFCGPIKKAQASTRKLGYGAAVHAISLFDFANGATGVLELGWAFPSSGMSLEIYGSKGSLKFPNAWTTFVVETTDGKKPKTVEVEKLKKVPNSHASFLRSIASGDTRAWEGGRMAVAICEAIADAAAAQSAQPVKYRKASAK